MRIAVSLALTAALVLAVDAAPRAAPKRRAVVIPHGHALIAVPRVRRVKVYGWPRAKRPILVLDRKTRYGARRVFLVDWKKRRWTWPRSVRVFLPLRPNGRRGG